MIVRKPSRVRPAVAACLAAVALGFLLLPSSAAATELDQNDPNGPPPMPPPMPAPGQPGSTTPPPPPGSTEAHLAQSDVEDNGIGLKLAYLQPEIGFGWASLGGAIPAPASAPVDYTQFRTGSGPIFGVGGGLQFITFQMGARLRALSTRNFNLWNVGGELMFQPGSGRLWPRFGVSVGYAWGASWNQDMCGAQCNLVDVSGLSVGARGGLQYFVSSHVDVGFDLTFDALMLKRAGVNPHPVLGQDSSGTGVALGALAHLGFHFP